MITRRIKNDINYRTMNNKYNKILEKKFNARINKKSILQAAKKRTTA